MTPDLVALVDGLRDRPVNYDVAQAPPVVTDGWHRDRVGVVLGTEEPGPIADHGLARTAVDLVDSYEFAHPAILRAVYRVPAHLLGRDMLLVGRFAVLRFAMGVRITETHDEVVDGEHRIGWTYQTLAGHLEQGRLTYQVAKDVGTGRVEFRIIAYSRRGHIRNPVVALGFRLFGRRTQMRFYHHSLRRLARLVGDPPDPPDPLGDGLARAPGGRPPWRGGPGEITLVHPGY